MTTIGDHFVDISIVVSHCTSIDYQDEKWLRKKTQKIQKQTHIGAYVELLGETKLRVVQSSQ